MSVLPEQFSDLERFVEHWDAPNFQERFERRFAADIGQIRAFYDAVLPRTEEILTALEGQPLDALKGPWLRLYRLLMGAAHAAHAIERHGQPRPAASTYPNKLVVIQASSPD